MSAQINLYHPRYLKQREWLALGPVAGAATAVYVLMAALAGWAWQDAAQRKEQAAAADAQLKATKDQVAAATKAAAERKPSPQLQAEVESAEALVRRRGEIVGLLEGGIIGSTDGFSEHFRGLARQAPEGLWLTGFSANAGGEMEIRGSTLHAAAVPDYIRRLGGEKAFQGRSFAALTMTRPDTPAQASRTAGGATAVPPTPAPAVPAALRPIDFVLLPKPVEVAGTKP